MPKYIAFLRAINVGGHTVKMDYLRQLFTDMGFTQVESFIASGNIIFDSAVTTPQTLEQTIASSLHQSLGYKVTTFLRTPAELAAIVQHKPFPDEEITAEGHYLYIGFLSGTPGDEAVEKLMGFRTAADDFHVNGRELYWLVRKKISDSEFSGARLEKTLRMEATLRNSTTVRKLTAKYSQVE